MNATLWKNILEFDFDQPISEYGFSTRLENENCWTTNFSSAAIIEYKKFMYLAAVSESMVSPSEIIDIVWHQHLIFTESYDRFCVLLGKKIIHMPYTHQRSDFDKFSRAKEYTSSIYRENFGGQPKEFWEYSGMLEGLQLKKSGFSESFVFLMSVLLFIPLVFVGFFLLKPLYVKIDNPYFFILYTLVISVSIISLEIYNRSRLNKIASKWNKRAFVFNLSAFELIYLRRNQIQDAIHGIVNHLVLNEKVSLLANNKLSTIDRSDIQNSMVLTVLQTISSNGKISYPDLLGKLKRKPMFNKTVRAMEGFKKYFNNSKCFIELLIVNLTVLLTVLIFGTVRIATGFFRDKPVIIIGIVVIVFLLFIVQYLYRLKSFIGSVVLPKFYHESVISEKPDAGNWEWNYFLLGSGVFAASFAALVSRSNSDRSFLGSSEGDSGGSCSSGGDGGGSCGGDGGGSCGGCGGSD